MLLYHVQAELKPRVDLRRFQEALNPAHSWYRLSNVSWIICTDETAFDWVRRLNPHVRTVFVSRLDLDDHYGTMVPEFWTWLRQHLPA